MALSVTTTELPFTRWLNLGVSTHQVLNCGWQTSIQTKVFAEEIPEAPTAEVWIVMEWMLSPGTVKGYSKEIQWPYVLPGRDLGFFFLIVNDFQGVCSLIVEMAPYSNSSTRIVV